MYLCSVSKNFFFAEVSSIEFPMAAAKKCQTEIIIVKILAPPPELNRSISLEAPRPLRALAML